MVTDSVRLTPRERIEYRAARVLASLPAALQVQLSGKPLVSIDGDTLAPETQMRLALLERRREPPTETLSPEEARRSRRRLSAVFAGPLTSVGAVRDIEIEAQPPLRARHYVPAQRGGSQPLLVYFHGGGFLFGDLETHDGVCRLLCLHAGAQVLAVDYRLAPEHPFPAAVEDARAALRWAVANADRLGADPRRVGVAGDSAGGNLAAVVSQLAARDGGPAPVLQVLIYPGTDFTRKRRSRDLFAEGFLLTDAEMNWFETNYLGAAREQAHDPRASPLLAQDLSGLAPALVVTAAFDPLRDEGEEYARALQAAGTATTLRRFPGFIHAFVSAAGVSPRCRDAVIEIAGATRAMFAAAVPPAEVAPAEEAVPAADVSPAGAAP
jgi:acetyl esterase